MSPVQECVAGSNPVILHSRGSLINANGSGSKGEGKADYPVQ